MKGSCPKCGDIIDETEYIQFKKLCVGCRREEDRYYGRGLKYENKRM